MMCDRSNISRSCHTYMYMYTHLFTDLIHVRFIHSVKFSRDQVRVHITHNAVEIKSIVHITQYILVIKFLITSQHSIAEH